MIKVQRTAPPKRLIHNAPKWTDELLAAIQEHQRGGRKPAENLWNRYNKQYVKNALRAMFHDKCAYCESKITHIDYPHIEHYRPKKIYPQYAFEWQNLLLACAKCNGKEYKGDNFPLENDDQNQPLLLNPCADDPIQHLYFEQARLVPLSERGRQTRDLLGLNRDELFDRRREWLIGVYFIRSSIETYRHNGDEAMARLGEDLLAMKASTKSEYTAMVWQFMANPLPEQPPL